LAFGDSNYDLAALEMGVGVVFAGAVVVNTAICR